jgi:hypothetical protein
MARFFLAFAHKFRSLLACRYKDPADILFQIGPCPDSRSGAAYSETVRELHVLNSLASGRRLALRIVLLQLAVAALVGIAFLTQGLRDAIAGAAGAAIVALGTALLAARTFAGLGGGGMTMGRLLIGMVLKWMAIIGGLIVILGQYKLPPLAAITGLVAAYAINLLAFRFKG